MAKRVSKYRPIIYLLLLFYANFFFLSTYIHEHQLEDRHSENNSKLIHSHLFNFSHSNSHNEEIDNQYDDEHHHSHFLLISNFYAITQNTDIVSTLNIDINTPFEILNYNSKESIIHRTPIEYFPNSQWDKYVQSATNVSPPLS